MKTVSQEEFNAFIEGYKGKLERNQWNDVTTYHDFSLGDLTESRVARANYNHHPGGVAEYFIILDKGE